MTVTAWPATSRTAVPVARCRTGARRPALAVSAAVGLLGAAVLLSLAVGSRSLPTADVVRVLLQPDASETSAIVRELRLPRTVLGLVVGAALGLAGAQLQGLTRNPLADPGLLGVSAGAALAVVSTGTVLGVGGATGQAWAAFGGALAATLAVWLLAGTTGRTTSPPSQVVTEARVQDVFGLSCAVVPCPVTGRPLVVARGRARGGCP